MPFDFPEIAALAAQAGFIHYAPLDVSTIELRSEVRDMCASGGCGQYGKCWSCPPGCGELAQNRERVAQYTRGLLVQTVAQLEDDFDAEGMLQAQNDHKAHFAALIDALRPRFPAMLPLGAGRCDLCRECTYPDAPCRFPEKAVSSMEAYGMLVHEVCSRNGLPYYHGPGTLAYVSCILLE